MTTDFEHFLHGSAPDIPDPGNTRRLNRQVLSRQLSIHSRHRRLGGQAAVALASLALVGMVFVGDLGSDSFEVTGEMAVRGPAGDRGVQKILRLGERGQPIPQLDGWSEEDAKELANQAYNDEGRLLNIVGYRTDTAESWDMGFSSEINGESWVRSRNAEGMPMRVGRAFVDFIADRGGHIAEDPEAVLGPPVRTETLTIEGVAYPFGVWTFEDPDQGSVTLYRWDAGR